MVSCQSSGNLIWIENSDFLTEAYRVMNRGLEHSWQLQHLLEKQILVDSSVWKGDSSKKILP